VREKVRGVVAIGESAAKVLNEIGTLADEQGMAATMEDAIQQARRMAHHGDVVLLSPACSSFDMYDNYEDRGDTFRRLVNSL
jgi:UDP-N-acetylmuramoylalanine--D-glutamate ligase